MNLWYAAHIVMFVKRKHKPKRKIPIWENVVLLKAESEELAYAQAHEIGKRGEGNDDGTFRWGGEEAEWVFAGVRKIALCEDAEKRPGAGAEITYTEMEVDSEQAVWNLIEGKTECVRILDTFSEPKPNNAKLGSSLGLSE